MNGAWSRIEITYLGAVLLLAATLRLYHIDYGLPGVQYVDSFMYVGEAARMLDPGDYVPQSFQNPSLYVDIQARLFWLLGLKSVYAQHLAARYVSTTFSLLLIVVLYAMIRRDSPAPAAVIAAVLTALCPITLTAARTEATDATLTFFMTATLALLTRRPTRLLLWVAVGVLAGLATGTKYTGAFVLPFVALAATIVAFETRAWTPPLAGAAVAFVCAGLVFVATTPWFLKFFSAYASAFQYQSLVQQTGQVGRVQAGYWDYFVSSTPSWEQPWLGTSLLTNLGPALFVASVTACLWALLGAGGFARRFEALYVLLFLAVTCGPGRPKAIRYLLPVLPFLYALVACATAWLLRRLTARPLATTVAAAALLVIFASYPGARSLRYLAASARPMTNDAARAWMSENVQAASRVFLSPFFVENLADLPLQFLRLRGAATRQYRLPEGKGESGERSPVYYPGLVDQMRLWDVRYVVLNSWYDDAFSPVPENLLWFPRSVASYRAFKERLESTSTLVWRVRGMAEGRLGPDIEVYRLN